MINRTPRAPVGERLAALRALLKQPDPLDLRTPAGTGRGAVLMPRESSGRGGAVLSLADALAARRDRLSR